MSDDTDDRTLQASAYLDNEVTPDERAQIEADPDTIAEVDELGQVRDVLGATAPRAPLSEREAHLAAALDVFDRMSDMERSGEITPSSGVDAAAAAAVSTPQSSSDTGRHRRPEKSSRSNWLLGAAAGLLVLAGAGVVARSALTSDGDDSTEFSADEGSDDAAASEVQQVEDLENDEVLAESGDLEVRDDLDGDDAMEDLSDEAAADDRGDTATDATATGAADEGDADDAMEDEDAMEEDAMEDDASEEDSVETLPATAEQPEPPAEEDLAALETEDDLAAFALFAMAAAGPDGGAPELDIDVEPPFDSCEARLDVERRAGYALYQGTVVQVGIDFDRDVVLAYTEPACEVIATTGLVVDDTPSVDSVPSTEP